MKKNLKFFFKRFIYAFILLTMVLSPVFGTITIVANAQIEENSDQKVESSLQFAISKKTTNVLSNAPTQITSSNIKNYPNMELHSNDLGTVQSKSSEKILTSNNCLTDPSGKISIDNSISGGKFEGCLVDYSNFPIVIVKVYNRHDSWSKIEVFRDYDNVIKSRDNIWAQIGYIPGEMFAQYTFQFDENYNNDIYFFVSIAKDSTGQFTYAGALNILGEILSNFGASLEAVNDESTFTAIIDAINTDFDFATAVNKLNNGDLLGFTESMIPILGDTEAAKNLIINVGAKLGVAITKSQIKNFFIGYKIYEICKHIWLLSWSTLSGSYAGTIIINSKVQADPIIRKPVPSVSPRVTVTPTPPPTSDNSSFVQDITLPVGTVVSQNQSLTKTWRVKNNGTSTWNGYRLKFIDSEQMNGPTDITLPTIAPGETKDISITLKAPASSGLHAGAWQIINNSGTWLKGGKLWVKINVQTDNSAISLDVDPPSPSSADKVRIHAKVVPFTTFRAMRVLIDGSVIYELGTPEFYFDWNTNGAASGDHSIIVEVADQTDTSWSKPQRKGLVYTLEGNPAPVNHAPNRPILITNPAYDWYVTIGNAPQLCTQAQGDPDGDAISQYRFVATASIGTADSGWVNSACHTFGSITPGTYEWHTQVKDINGGISDWSDKWHFTIEPSGVTATIDKFSPSSASNSEEVKIYACSSGHAGVNITLRVLVNEANDGSDSGKWNIIKEQGSPCFNDTDVPIWRTLGYSDGPHRVRVVAWAVQPDAGDIHDEIYTLNHRRPNSPDLIAPVPLSQIYAEPVYVNSRTITFKWSSALQATSYKLHVSTNPEPAKDSNPVLRQVTNSTVNEFTTTFTQDYPTFYWQVEAINDVGSNYSGVQTFGIDRQSPTCSMQSPAPPVYENIFQMNWSGTDNLAEISSYDIQYKDSSRDTWQDWLGDVPVAKGYELFNGQPGHKYYFRCRAKDNAGNMGNYPENANSYVTVDPSMRPPSPWWNDTYSQKRNIILLNNMPDITLPSEYPVHIHFDSSTTPTAEELYNASLSNPKCNDLRIIYDDTTELNRVVQNCSSSAIDIWFRSHVAISAGSSNNTSHQIYFGNSSTNTPPADSNLVWYPFKENDSVYLFNLQEGSGSTAYDSSGNNRNCSINSSVQWSSGKFSNGLKFVRANSGDTRSLTCGSASLSSFTIDFWMKPENDGDGRIAGQLGSSGNLNWLLSDFGGRIRLDVWPCSSCGSSEVHSDVNLHDSSYVGKWNHVAVSFNGGNEVKFYVNGSLNSTKYLGQSGLNQYNVPLEIGSVEGIGQIHESLGGFRISSGVKSSFSYGSFANITNEPTTAVGDIVAPPATGTPDLSILSLNSYPNPEGGFIVQVQVQNQGTLDTKSGFYTDLYLNHLPTGAGDYDGSLSFWINDPIPAGEIVTLSTVITDLSELEQSVIASSNSLETSGTLYALTDSVGIVAENDKQNNIFSTGVEVCTAKPDTYETDNVYSTTINQLSVGESQNHNFDSMEDQDWISFDAEAGQTYVISTSDLGDSGDTLLELYDTDGTTLLTSNDDYESSLASQIEWQASETGEYLILAKNWNPYINGCGTSYTITLTQKAPCYTLTTNVLPSDAGSIFASPSPNCNNSTQYSSGTTVKLTANPNINYAFNNWSGDITGSTNPINLVMDESKDISGVFELSVRSPFDGFQLTSNRPTFIWDNIPNATAYNLQISKTMSFSKLVVNIITSSPSYTITKDLSPKTLLYWRVRPRFGKAYGGWIPTWSFETANPPSIPSLILPSNKSLTTIYTPTLVWKGSSNNPDHYQIQIATVSTFTDEAIVLDKTTTNTYYQTDVLTPNSTFYWHVRSYNSAGHSSSWSSSRSFRTALLPPNLTLQNNGVTTTSLRPTMDWDDVDGASSYYIQISKEDTFRHILKKISPITSTYTPTSDLPTNTKLYWRVRANGTNGPSAWSEVRNFTTANPPSIPSLASPSNKSLTTIYTPTMAWKSSSNNPDHYQVQIATVSTFTDESIVLDKTSTNTYYQAESLPPNSTYYWHVRSFNSIEQFSSWSSTRSFRTALLSPVVSLQGEELKTTNRRPTLDWENVDGASGYYIQISKYFDFSRISKSSSPKLSTYKPSSDLSVNTKYYWRVRANGKNGPSSWSEINSFTIISLTAPKSISPENGTLITTIQPTLLWEQSQLASGTKFANYQLQVAEEGTFTTLILDIQQQDILNTQYTILDELESDTIYYWRVRAIDTAQNNSDWSEVFYFSTPLQAPLLTSPNITVSFLTLRPSLDWEDMNDAVGYSIQIANDIDFANIIISDSTTESIYTPTSDLPYNTTFYWRVKTSNSNGSSSEWSNIGSFTIGLSAPILTSPDEEEIITNSRPEFKWEVINSAIGYNLEISTKSDFSDIFLTLSSTEATFTPNADLPAHTKLYWRVQAIGTNSFGFWSNPRSFTTGN